MAITIGGIQKGEFKSGNINCDIKLLDKLNVYVPIWKVKVKYNNYLLDVYVNDKTEKVVFDIMFSKVPNGIFNMLLKSDAFSTYKLLSYIIPVVLVVVFYSYYHSNGWILPILIIIIGIINAIFVSKAEVRRDERLEALSSALTKTQSQLEIRVANSIKIVDEQSAYNTIFVKNKGTDIKYIYDGKRV